MSNEHSHLKSFTTNGRTTSEGQRNAGTFEAQSGYQPSSQSLHESFEAYAQRVNSYNHTKNNGQ